MTIVRTMITILAGTRHHLCYGNRWAADQFGPSSTSGKAARISSAILSPSQTSRLPRCWGRSCSRPRFSTHYR